MRGVISRASLGLAVCALFMIGCESDESLKVQKTPYLEILEGGRQLASGTLLRVNAPRQVQEMTRRSSRSSLKVELPHGFGKTRGTRSRSWNP